MDGLFAQLEKHKNKIERLGVTFGLINELNTIGRVQRAPGRTGRSSTRGTRNTTCSGGSWSGTWRTWTG